MPSDKHIELSKKALVWLMGKATNRGIRGTTEVGLREGYVVDAAALCGLTLQNEKMLAKNDRFSSVECVDYSFIFETKVSRSDFMKTFVNDKHIGDRLKPVVNFHFIVCAKGIVSPNEVPEFWGMLEESGKGLKLVKLPSFQKTEITQLYEFAYIILRSSHGSKFTLWTEEIKRFEQELIEN